jgi:hypothetical protein
MPPNIRECLTRVQIFSIEIIMIQRSREADETKGRAFSRKWILLYVHRRIFMMQR